jgi:porin
MGSLGGVCLSSPAFADDEKPNFSSEKLTGNWGGMRDKLYDRGYSFDMYYKVDSWRNFSGGVNEGNRSMDNLDLVMTIDGEKAFHSKGTTALVQLLNNDGGRINDVVGSNGGIDNIEAPTHAFKLYQAWVQQNFWDDRVSVLAGLHDLNSEFYVTDTSGLFLNPTYGIGTEMAATGDNGPSIFPVTSLGARISIQPTKETYIMGAVYDGVPGDPDNARGTHIQLKNKEGALLVGEGGIRDSDIGHFGFGAWEYTAKRPDQQTSEAANSQGFYFLADKSIYKNDGKDISTFGRLGYASGDIEQFRSNWSLGVVLSGFMPCRPDGQLGFAVTGNANSRKYKTVNAPVDNRETQYELTYGDKLTPWLSIQPDLQYTVNPGTNPALDNAWTGGIRVGVDF